MRNRWVFRAVLKVGREGASLMFLGSSFQRVGAATEKALSPHVRRLVLGGLRRPASLDLREREGLCGLRRLERYGGARLCSDL